MSKVVLKVTYSVRADQMKKFEAILLEGVVPLAEQLGIRFGGAWKTLVGSVGAYLEFWEFDSLSEFETKWKRLFEHPEFEKILETTGQMVMNEKFEILEPVFRRTPPKTEDSRHFV